MKKLPLLSLTLALVSAALATAGPVSLYRIDLRPGTNAYEFAARNGLPVFYAGRSSLLAGYQPDAKRFPQITSMTLVYTGDSKDLRWVHARRGATPADLSLPALFSENGAVLVRAPQQAKDIDRARFMLSSFNAAPVVLPRNPANINPGLTADTAIARIAQQVTVANFQATDSALQAFNTRSTGAPNHPQVAEWIKDQFLSFGIADVKIDSYLDPGFLAYLHSQGVTGSPLIRNVIATIQGSLDTHTVYVVGGHYDTSVWPYNPWAPGADDNGSGTTAAIEMARVMAANPPNCTVKFVAFDCEEWGLYGSQKFAADAHGSGMSIGCMMNYDMIANLGNDSLFNSEVYPGSEPQAHLLATAAAWYGRTNDTNLAVVYTTGDLSGSDSWSFYQNGFTQAYAEEYDFSPHWHQTTDSTTFMNMRYGTSIVRAGIGMLATLANYPQPVAGLAVADPGDGASLAVSWQPAAAGNITGYRLCWGKASGAYSDSVLVAGSSRVINGLLTDTLYCIGTSAVDGGGRQSPFINQVTGTPRLAPQAPAGVTATPVAGGIRVDWKRNTELDIAGYRLYRKIDTGSPDSMTALADTTYADQPLSGAHRYYYTVRAYDTDGNASPGSDEAYGRPLTLDQGVLVVDETYNWTSGNYPRDAQQDSFYEYLMAGYRHEQYDFGVAVQKPLLADLVPYSMVVWHSDDPSQFLAANDSNTLRDYMSHGGKLWFTGWKPTSDIRGTPGYPVDFGAGTLLYDWFAVRHAELSGTADSFRTAVGLRGYPDITVDTTKYPVTIFGKTLRNIEALAPAPGADTIYAMGMKNNGSPFQGRACAVRDSGKAVLFGFPLYYLSRDQARLAAHKVMAEFGEPYLGVHGTPGNAGRPATLRLHPGTPNPFTAGTAISYELPAAGRVEITVYNVAGQKVRTLASGAMPPGIHLVHWDGRDEKGMTAASGVYLCRLRAGGGIRTGKLILMR